MNDTYQIIREDDELWLSGVRKVESPNYDERPASCSIDLIVIHGISLPPASYGGPYIDQLFTNSLDVTEHEYFRDIIELRVSSHLLVDRKGNITQYVPLNKRAWHAGESEFCGRKVCNDYSIGIELEGTDDMAYEPIQYTRLAEISVLLMRHWQAITKERIVGHSDIAPGRKTDPGEAFNWQYYFNKIDELT